MKKILVLIAALVVGFQAKADNNIPVTLEQMPAPAQEFIKTHFAAKTMTFAVLEKEFFGEEYNVLFTDGTTMAFDSKGNWKSVECKRGDVIPWAAVPAQIAQFVNQTYPNVQVYEIDRDNRGYDVKLTNRVELEFNANFQVVDMDYDD